MSDTVNICSVEIGMEKIKIKNNVEHDGVTGANLVKFLLRHSSMCTDSGAHRVPVYT